MTESLLFFDTLFSRTPAPSDRQEISPSQKSSRRSSNSGDDSNPAIVRFDPPTRLTSFQVIPNRTRAFPAIPADNRCGQTCPDSFGLQLTVHHYVDKSGGSSTKLTSFDVNVDLAQGALAPKWDLDLDQDARAHMIIFRGQFDAITLAVYGHPLDSLKLPTGSITNEKPSPINQDPTLDDQLILAKQLLSSGPSLRDKNTLSQKDQDASLHSCVQNLFKPPPLIPHLSSQDILPQIVQEEAIDENFKKELDDLAQSCFDHDPQPNSINRFVEGLVALCDQNIISRVNLSSFILYALNLANQLVRISLSALCLLSTSSLVEHSITILKTTTSDLAKAREASVDFLTICSEQPTLLYSHVMGKFALADSFKWLAGHDHLVVRFKVFLTILELSKFTKRLDQGVLTTDDDLDGTAIESPPEDIKSLAAVAALTEFELMKFIHLFQRLLGYMSQCSFIPFSSALNHISSDLSTTPQIYSTSTTYKALLSYFTAEDLLSSLLTLLNVQFKSPCELAWEKRGKDMMIECVIQFFTSLFTNPESGLPFLVQYFSKADTTLVRWTTTLDTFLPATSGHGDEEKNIYAMVMMLCTTRNWQSISLHEPDRDLRVCLAAIRRLVTGYTSLGALLSVVFNQPSEQLDSGTRNADEPLRSNFNDEMIKLGMKKLESLSGNLLFVKLLNRLVSCEEISNRLVQLNHVVRRKSISTEEPRNVFDWYAAVVLSEADIILSPNAKVVGKVLMNHSSTFATKPSEPSGKLRKRANLLMSIEDPSSLFPSPATIQFADLWEVEVRVNVLGALSNLGGMAGNNTNAFGQMLRDQFNEIRKLTSSPNGSNNASFNDVIIHLVEIIWRRLESLKKKHQLYCLKRLMIHSTLFEAIRRLVFLETKSRKVKLSEEFVKSLSEKLLLINMILADSIRRDTVQNFSLSVDFALSWVYEKKFRMNLISLLRSLTWSPIASIATPASPDETIVAYSNQSPNESFTNSTIEIDQTNLIIILESTIRVAKKLEEDSPVVLDFFTRCLPLVPQLGRPITLNKNDKQTYRTNTYQQARKSMLEFKELVNTLATYLLDYPNVVMGPEPFFGKIHEPSMIDSRINQIKIWGFSKLIYSFDLINLSPGSFLKVLIRKTLTNLQSIIEASVSLPQNADSRYRSKSASNNEIKDIKETYHASVALLYSCWIICSDYLKKLPANAFGNCLLHLWPALKFGLEYPDQACSLILRQEVLESGNAVENAKFSKYLDSVGADYLPSCSVADPLSPEMLEILMKQEIESVGIIIKCFATCRKHQANLPPENRLDRCVFDGGNELSVINTCFKPGYYHDHRQRECDLNDIDFIPTLTHNLLGKSFDMISLNLLGLSPPPIPPPNPLVKEVPPSIIALDNPVIISPSLSIEPQSPVKCVPKPIHNEKSMPVAPRRKPTVPDLYPPIASSQNYSVVDDEPSSRRHHYGPSPPRRPRPLSYPARPRGYEHYDPKSQAAENSDAYHARKPRDSDEARRLDSRDLQIRRESDRSRYGDRYEADYISRRRDSEPEDSRRYRPSHNSPSGSTRHRENDYHDDEHQMVVIGKRKEQMSNHHHHDNQVPHEVRYKVSRRFEDARHLSGGYGSAAGRYTTALEGASFGGERHGSNYDQRGSR